MRRRVHETAGSGQAEEKSRKGKAGEAQVRSSWRLWLKWTFLALGVLYVVTPFLLRLFPGIVQHLVYSHAILYFVDLSCPADLGLNHTANMYLTSEVGVTLAVWHTVPEKRWKEAQGKGLDWYEKSLGDGSPVFIYFHGNTNNSLKKMRTPLLMLHAEDDQVTPFKMAQELYSIAREALKSDKRIKLVSFDRSLRYGHNGLYKDPALPGIIREFVQTLAA
ncbi:hypothetical protein AOLI_G00020270 [Acnodon oligacanthus]